MYNEAHEILLKASQLHDQGDLAEARILYHQVLSLDSDMFEVKRLLGVVYIQMKDHTAAIACLLHALREHKDLKDEKKALVWTNLSTAYLDLQQHENVVHAARQAIHFNHRMDNAWNNMGRSLKALGRSKEAAHAFQRAIEIKNPDTSRP